MTSGLAVISAKLPCAALCGSHSKPRLEGIVNCDTEAATQVIVMVLAVTADGFCRIRKGPPAPDGMMCPRVSTRSRKPEFGRSSE
jgi:hypothetical protein